TCVVRGLQPGRQDARLGRRGQDHQGVELERGTVSRPRHQVNRDAPDCPPPFGVSEPISRMTRQGFPEANTPSGMSLVTTLPAPMTAFEPIFTPGQMITPP